MAKIFARLMVVGFFLLFFMSRLVQDGMFIDGVMYAALARNLSEGIGSFWSLRFSDSIFQTFYEHPPLVIGIESLFFKILGPGFSTERIYCGLVALYTLSAITSVWRRIFPEMAGYYIISTLPLLLWMTNEDANLSYTANILECTMTLFDMLAVLFLLDAYPVAGQPPRKAGWRLVAAAFCLVAAFLCKGPTGLYPLAFFFIHLAMGPKDSSPVGSWWRAVSLSAILTGLTAALLGLLLLHEPARLALGQYFQQQVMAALVGERHENIAPHRLYMLQRFLETHIVNFAIIGIGAWLAKRRQQPPISHLVFRKIAWLALLGAAALLPLMLSPKQAPHYIVPALPWFSLAFGGWFGQYVPGRNSISLLLLISAVATLCLGIVFTASNWGKTKPELAELKPLFEHLPLGEQIVFLEREEALIKNGYFQRYNLSTIDRKGFGRRFIAVEKGVKIPEEERVQLLLVGDFGRYSLYKRE